MTETNAYGPSTVFATRVCCDAKSGSHCNIEEWRDNWRIPFDCGYRIPSAVREHTNTSDKQPLKTCHSSGDNNTSIVCDQRNVCESECEDGTGGTGGGGGDGTSNKTGGTPNKSGDGGSGGGGGSGTGGGGGGGQAASGSGSERDEKQPPQRPTGVPSQTKVSRVLSPEETCLQSLQFMLDTTLVLGASVSDLKGIALSRADLPTSQLDGEKKLSHIFGKAAMLHKHDTLSYCIQCFVRTTKQSPKEWEPSMLTIVVHGIQEATVLTLASHLTTCNSSSDVWFAVNGSNSNVCAFLEAVSGWESDKPQLPTEMLRRVIKQWSKTNEGKKNIGKLVSAVGTEVKAVKRVDEVMEKAGKYLNAFSTLTQEPEVVDIIAEELLAEVQTADKGSFFDGKSIFSELLSLSTVVQHLSRTLPSEPKYACFVGLQNFPNILMSDLISCHSHIQDSLHHCQSLVHATLLKALKSKGKNNVVAWLSAVVSLNERRAGPKFKQHSPEGVCGDAFMLNFCAVMLELCKPFFTSSTSGSKLDLIAHNYTTSKFCRLDLCNEPCLASGYLTGEGQTFQGHKRFLAEGSDIKFVTECFYITQRALHIGLIPAMETFTQTMSELHKQQESGKVDEKAYRELIVLYNITWSCCILDPQFVQYCCQFYITQAVWLMHQMDLCLQGGQSIEAAYEVQRKRLQAFPEHSIKDMVTWFRFIVGSRPNLLQGLEITVFVDCCVMLLERTDLLPGPVAQSKIISVLLSFVNGPNEHRQLPGAASWSGISGDLSATVHASPAVRDHLGPALLHSYVAVSVVEGLDVDKENFDRYSARYDIAQLLQHLWLRPDCRESILRVCGTKKFESFLGAVFDTLLYQFNDSLIRLGNIRQIEQAKEDASHWSALSPKDRHDKEQFLASEQRVARGFLKLANFQLLLLETMSESDAVSKCFCVPPLSIRTATAMLGFLNSLCGPRATELKVKDKETYAFVPRKLIGTITTIVLRIWKQESNMGESSFVKSMAMHPEYSAVTMSHVVNLLARDNQAGAQAFKLFMDRAEAIQQESGMVVPECRQQEARPADTRWQAEAKAIRVDQDCLKDLYVSAMEPSKHECTALADVHTYSEKAQSSSGPQSLKVNAILRDVKQLQDALPIHPDSAIFVRQDEEHMDLVRVLITGPVDTPYSRGCFVFDVYYPSTYPNNPPLVTLITTANKTVRFNPNLYADGKVCLSLLGTWHGGDPTEKWDPSKSNLLQVLLSIQGMILIPDPMFNEPGYEAIRRTEEGNRRSGLYNADVQVHTIRHAMLDQLRNPPAGFENLIKAHFTIQRDIILKQIAEWLDKAVNPEHEQRLRRAIDELRVELEKL